MARWLGGGVWRGFCRFAPDPPSAEVSVLVLLLLTVETLLVRVTTLGGDFSSSACDLFVAIGLLPVPKDVGRRWGTLAPVILFWLRLCHDLKCGFRKAGQILLGRSQGLKQGFGSVQCRVRLAEFKPSLLMRRFDPKLTRSRRVSSLSSLRH